MFSLVVKEPALSSSVGLLGWSSGFSHLPAPTVTSADKDQCQGWQASDGTDVSKAKGPKARVQTASAKRASTLRQPPVCPQRTGNVNVKKSQHLGPSAVPVVLFVWVLLAKGALNENLVASKQSAARHTAPAERVPGLTSPRADRIVTG